MPRREGAFWVLFALAAPRFIGAILTIVLRRFLGPAASGLFDTAYVPYKFLDSFRTFGTGPALVYERRLTPEVADTAWTLNMLFAIALTVIAQLLAHPLALYYGHPRIEPVFRVLSIAYVFGSISSAHSFLLMRDLNFRARSLPALGQVVAAGAIAILVAAWGFGIGALVAREVASVAVGSVVLWIIHPFRPRPTLILPVAWSLLRYGAWIGAGLAILYLSQNVDVFIGGRIIRRAGDVGFYTTSWSLAFISAGVFTTLAGGMVFPTLSRLHRDEEAWRATLLRGVRQIGMVMLPMAALLAVVAPVIIVPLLGGKWLPYRGSSLVLSLLAVYAGNRTMLGIFFEGYKAIGRPWIVPIYNAVKLVIMVPAMIVGAQHGIVGLAVTYIPIQMIELPVALSLAYRILGVSPLAVWRATRVPIAGTLLMAGGVVAVEVFLKSHLHVRDVVALAACLATAVPLYLGALAALDRGIFAEARSVLTRGLY